MLLDARELRQKKIYLVFRILLGGALIIFALMSIFDVSMDGGRTPSGESLNLMKSLVETGYIMGAKDLVFLIAGSFLLLNIFVPFSLVILAPFSLNAFLYHLFLDLPGILFSAILIALHIAVAIFNWDAFSRLFVFRDNK